MRRLLPVLLLASCTDTPTVPVPPPDAASIVFHEANGQATYRAGSDDNWPYARVLVFDLNTGRGVITTAEIDGSVAETAPFVANDGDRVQVTYQEDGQSAGLCLILHEGPAVRCP